MHAFVMSSLIFAIVFAWALAGMALRRVLPQEHFGTDAKDTVRLAVGLVVTMTGLVLGMLVSSAKTYYDGQKVVVAEMSSQVILLNTLLVDYGPEANEARRMTHQFVEDALDRIWPKDNGQRVNVELEMLVPTNGRQAAIKTQVVSMIQDLGKSYWLMFLESEQTSISFPLLVVVTSWLVTIFISFGIFAPPNATVRVTLIVCAFAVSAAIFIIMEMYSPFSGILKISPVAIRDALSQMAVDR